MTDRLTRTRALESSGTQSDAAERIATEIDNPLGRQPVGSGTEGEQHSPRAIDQAPHGEEPLVRATKRLVAATKVLAVVGALGFGAALLQWLALRSTDEKVSQEVTALQGQVAALNKSADASTKAAEAANRSVAIAETAERAWIALSEIAFVNPADADNPLKVRLSYNNVGHQPAKSLKAWIDTGVIKEPPPNFEGWNAMTAWHKPALQPKSLCSQFADTQEVIVYPSSTIGFSIYTSKHPGILRYLEDIKSGNVIYIVIGCFSYETVGQPRLTSFCTFPHPLGAGKDLTQWKFSACPVGNDDFSP